MILALMSLQSDKSKIMSEYPEVEREPRDEREPRVTENLDVTENPETTPEKGKDHSAEACRPAGSSDRR